MSKSFNETEITASWSHVVPGTLRFETEGHHANKQTVEIRTRATDGSFDGNTRRIATSDLFQCFWTVETKAELDKRRRSIKRMLKAGGEKAAQGEALAANLDDMWRARTEVCLLDPSHPRIAEARAKLREAEAASERREERKAKPAPVKVDASEAAAALGIAA